MIWVLLDNFGKNWATFYSIIWSHCSQTSFCLFFALSLSLLSQPFLHSESSHSRIRTFKHSPQKMNTKAVSFFFLCTKRPLKELWDECLRLVSSKLFFLLLYLSNDSRKIRISWETLHLSFLTLFRHLTDQHGWRKLIIRRSWVRIPAPDTGCTCFNFFYNLNPMS